MRSGEFYAVLLPFFGMTILALTTIGRETSLNTFSSLMSQPVERIRTWNTKLLVLSGAFLLVFTVWLLTHLLLLNSGFYEDTWQTSYDFQRSYDVFITICLASTATFTGGLWTTLLLRQAAGAFWLTLLVPVTLSGFTSIFFVQSETKNLYIAVVSVVIGVYSIGGFLFARWLFFRAQDVGWSGGAMVLPEWTFMSRRSGDKGIRARKPFFALLKKELQLQQGILTGALGLTVLHVAIVLFRTLHPFDRDSAGKLLTSVFWMLWLIIPALLGSMAVAEERKLGVMEGQLCLPASRRMQYATKAGLTLGLGIFLGGVMPALIEAFGATIGGHILVFSNLDAVRYLILGCTALLAWSVLLSFLASTMARNFLQAIGLALAMNVIFIMCLPPLMNHGMIFYDSLAQPSILPAVIAVPVLSTTLLWLGYLNFKNFLDGWPLYRRNLLGLVGALVVIVVASDVIYYRLWEVFEPAEPAHGAPQMSLAAPPVIDSQIYGNLVVRLPDGRVWFDYVEDSASKSRWSLMGFPLTGPAIRSAGPERYLSGSNWVMAAVHRIDQTYEDTKGEYNHISGFTESVGIQPDGSLWASDKSDQHTWTGDQLKPFGNDKDWKAVATVNFYQPVVLLKKNGTLWSWGPGHISPKTAPQTWPGLRAYQPEPLDTDTNWVDIMGRWNIFAKKTDGSVWQMESLAAGFKREPDTVQSPFNTWSPISGNGGAYVRADGSIWIYQDPYPRGQWHFRTWQVGSEKNWVAATANWGEMVTLKSDGTLWYWDRDLINQLDPATAVPTRLGIHHDWVALTRYDDAGVLALAADGSLWFWPDRKSYRYQNYLLQLPKQPTFLANIFTPAN